MTGTPLAVVAVIRGRPEKKAQLTSLLNALVPLTLEEEGCVRYEMNVSEDGNTFVFTELWTTRPLWERHMVSPHLENFKAQSAELVEHFELFALTPVAGLRAA